MTDKLGYYFKILPLLAGYLIIFSGNLPATEEIIDLEGRVVSKNDNPIPSVRIGIVELRKQAFCDIDGKFRFENIKPGRYKLSISRIGFLPLDTIVDAQKSTSLLIKLEESDIITDDVVVTVTRSYKHIENLPIPVEVVSKGDIEKQGYLRLDEVISQEMGIPIIEDRGRGMQIQGLDADYALILLNGEPVSGRTGGVLNISRFSVGSFDRVEVVRGPSSSLYGSAALAGVINMITEKPVKPLQFGLSGRYGSFSTYDLAGDLSMATDDRKLGLNVFANTYRTEGFSVRESTISKAVPDNDNWTVNSELFYDVAKTVETRLSGRFNSESVRNKYFINEGGGESLINTDVKNTEANASFNIKHEITNRYELDARFYGTFFRTETEDLFDNSGALYDQYLFEQRAGKAEIQSTSLLGFHQLIGGTGIQFEEVESDNVAGGFQNSRLFFAYLQDDWQISSDINLIGSLRYDSHSDYENNLSPKVAASWKAIPYLMLRASVGSGFKAPDYEQLYLNWSLPSEGYTVFGIKNFQQDFSDLGRTGQISDTLINLTDISDLRPEKSWAFDAGFTYDRSDIFDVRLNIYRNQIKDLIEFLPVAIKSNGRLLYTYFNVQRIYTQGLETRVRVYPYDFLNLEFHYQLLMTADEDVLEALDDPNQSKYWKRDGNSDRRVRPDEYGGLFNRSTHSGAFRINLDLADYDAFLSLRGTFKSEYGFADVNGNTILDDPREYAPGYSIWYLSATKGLPWNFSLQAGINNIFDYKSLKTQLLTSGRTFYMGINYRYVMD